MEGPLFHLFVPHLSREWRPYAARAGRALEPALGRVMERAAAGLRGEAPSPEELLPHLARLLPEPREDEDLPAVLQRLRIEDLSLAWACLRGDAEAVAELERQYFHVVDAALAQIPDAAAQSAEIKQQLRDRLFVAPGKDGRPRIAQYSGRGDIRSWLRVAAIRCALNHLQRQGREVALSDEALAGLAAPGQDAELDLLKRRYRAEFKRAFEGALAALGSRDRNLLRYHYLERLNIDQIGAIHEVHRTTVARWLGRTRETLLAETRRLLMEQLRIERGEFESIMRLIESQLDASIARFLDTVVPDDQGDPSR